MNIEYVSPRITRSEWDSGAKSDVDVFEDQLRGWLFEQARAIAPNGHSGPAILALVSPFFEVTACYLKGESSRYHETEFLEHGLQAVFPKIDSVAHREYINEVRNGFAHEAMFRRAALHRADKNFPPFGMVNNFLHLDPWWILDRAEDYFDSYVAKVRNRDMSVYDNFFKFMMIRRGATVTHTPSPP